MAFFTYIFEVLLIIPLVVYISYLIDRKGKTRSEPTAYPVVGMLPAAIHNVHRAHRYVAEVLNECGGTYEFKGPWFSNADMVFTCDPANIHYIFNKNFANYPKGPDFRKIFDVMGDGIINVDFEMWEVHRKTTLSQFSGANFYQSLEKIIWGKVETGLIPVLDYFCEPASGDVDLQDVFHRLTFDSICRILLDYDPNSLSMEMPDVPCEKAFSSALEPLMFRHIVPEAIWKLQKRLRIGMEKRLLEALEDFDNFISPHVCIQKGDNKTFLAAFEKMYRENSETLIFSGSSTKFLKDTVLSLLFAGRDTMSTCLTWLFYLLALNPSSELKILEEIEAKLGMKEDDDKKWRFFTANESRKLVYLQGALSESLRLYPPVALEHKAAMRPDVLPSGHRVPANGRIIVSFYSVGRMETVWGKDCLQFKPERWITAHGGVKHEPSYKFPVFNVGPRMCLGKDMAFIEMKMIAAAMIYHYKIELVEGHPVAPCDSVILEAKYGLRVKLSRRNDN